MSLLSTDEVQALVATGLGAAALAELIDREEARLARALGTPLTGAIVQTLAPTRSWSPLYLARRPAAGITVTEGTTTLVEGDDFTVTGNRVQRTWPLPWSARVDIEYEPDDEADVRNVLIDLIRLVVTASPFQSESADGHSYVRASAVARERAQIIATLDPNRGRTHSVPVG